MESLFNAAATKGVAVVVSLYLVYWITVKLEKKLDSIIKNQALTNKNLVKLTDSLSKTLTNQKANNDK